MPATHLYLIRHGEVEERYHQVFGGCRIDMALSPLGLRHGQAAAQYLQSTALDAIYASPMLRVQQTMQPLLDQRGQSPTIMPDLREIDFGDWTGHHWEGVEKNFGISAYEWLEILASPTGIPNGESASALLARVNPCLQSILAAHAGQSVAVFCHGGIIRALLSLLLDLPVQKTAHFSIDYGSITHVSLDPRKRHRVEIELLNYQPLGEAEA